MADRIERCDKVLDDGGVVVQYDFSYVVENSGRENNFCVTVLASEMTNPSDADEAKTKANTKAAVIKAAWISQEVTIVSGVAAVVGTVTL